MAVWITADQQAAAKPFVWRGGQRGKLLTVRGLKA
jgi:hypothetical protein